MSFLFVVFISVSALLSPAVRADDVKHSISARIEKLVPKADDLFFSPKTKLDQNFYQTGLLHHWQMYGKTSEIQPEKFRGYILFGDPYHRGLKRISFLLGSDCSGFVHRFMQLVGVNLPYLKTRMWIHLAQALKSGDSEAYFKRQNASETPIDIKYCVWKSITSNFKLVENEAKLEVGDVVIYPKSEGVLGLKGHMGIVSAVKPAVMILQSKYPQGIIALPLEKSDHAFLRYTGELSARVSSNLLEALSAQYADSPESSLNCQNSGNAE